MNARVIISMSMDEAEAISAGLSDLLCWSAGFSAAREGTQFSGTEPYGLPRARDMNIRLKSAIGAAEELGKTP